MSAKVPFTLEIQFPRFTSVTLSILYLHLLDCQNGLPITLILEGKYFTFIWDDTEEDAKLIKKKDQMKK